MTLTGRQRRNTYLALARRMADLKWDMQFYSNRMQDWQERCEYLREMALDYLAMHQVVRSMQDWVL